MNMDYQEGYVDGLAGAEMQDRPFEFIQIGKLMEEGSYWLGFEYGLLDREAMLANQANAERSPC